MKRRNVWLVHANIHTGTCSHAFCPQQHITVRDGESVVIFWPVGLFILYWILKGRNVGDIPQGMKNKWSKMTGSNGMGRSHGSDNVVFDDFQQTQYDRIREIKDEIKERSRRFSDFRERARRRADEEEFNRFMNEAPVRNDI